MIHEFMVDLLQVKIYETRNALGDTAAKLVLEKINCLLSTQEEVNIIFAAAPSQNEFLSALCQEVDVCWARVNAFHMDEYVGLSVHSPQRFGHFLKKKIFDKLPFRSVHYLDGNAADLEKECQRYSVLLNKYPADIVCMGIGENTHLAFNDPHVADFKDKKKVKVVNLDDACRQQQVNDGCFGAINEVPFSALTLTVPSLTSGRFIYCMAPGKNKSEAVYATLKKPISRKRPASILRNHHCCILFLDADSATKFTASLAD